MGKGFAGCGGALAPVWSSLCQQARAVRFPGAAEATGLSRGHRAGGCGFPLVRTFQA